MISDPIERRDTAEHCAKEIGPLRFPGTDQQAKSRYSAAVLICNSDSSQKNFTAAAAVTASSQRPW